MPTKAESLTDAKIKLTKLQAKMTAIAMEMAAQVESLLGTLPLKEARQFLRVECGIPASDLRAFAGFAAAFGDSRAIVKSKGVPFTIVKALVASDPETRSDAVARIAKGSVIDTREIASIRRRVRTKAANAMQTLERTREKMVVDAATSRVRNAVKQFEIRVTQFVEDAFELIDCFLPWDKRYYDRIAHHTALQASASDMLTEYDKLFGPVGMTIEELDELDGRDPIRRLGKARFALKFFATCESDIFWADPLERSIENDIQKLLSPLFAVSQVTALPRYPKPVRRKVPLATRVPKRLSVVELCGGAGGMALGFHAAGFRHKAIYENDADAVKTLRANKPEWDVIAADIKQTDFTRYRGVDVLSGGVPCQSFSRSGKQMGPEDERDLFREALKAVEQMQPRAFVLENVMGFKFGRHAGYRADLLQGFDDLGYQCGIHTIDCQDYGVPQSRQRILVIGIRRTEAGVFTMPQRFPEWRTNLGDTLRDLMGANGWSGADTWADSLSDPLLVRNEMAVRGEVAPTLTRMKDGPRTNTMKRWADLNINIAGMPDEAPTDEEAAAAGMKFKPRLTARMRARIQAFPDGWMFEGNRDAVGRQIANAFPPIMARAVALAVFSALEGIEFDLEKMLRRPLMRTKPKAGVERPLLRPKTRPALSDNQQASSPG